MRAKCMRRACLTPRFLLCRPRRPRRERRWRERRARTPPPRARHLATSAAGLPLRLSCALHLVSLPPPLPNRGELSPGHGSTLRKARLRTVWCDNGRGWDGGDRATATFAPSLQAGGKGGAAKAAQKKTPPADTVATKAAKERRASRPQNTRGGLAFHTSQLLHCRYDDFASQYVLLLIFLLLLKSARNP